MTRVEIRLPPATVRRLKAEAKKRGQTLSAYIRALLVQTRIPGT